MTVSPQELAKLSRHLSPDGYLFLGGAETTMGIAESFKRMPFERAGCYCRSDSSAALLQKNGAA